MTWLWWAASALGSLGIIGAIVLAIFFPPMLLVVWKIVSNAFLWFFRTRIGFGIVVGVAVWYGTSWYQHRIDVQACEAEKAAFKVAQKKRDSDIAKDTEQFVRKQIADEYMAQQESDNALAQFKTETHAANPDRKCPVGADAPRLRQLWGQSRGAKSQGHKRVQ